MANCPECDAEIEVDEFDVDKGDQLSCPECGSNLEVVGLSAVETDMQRDRAKTIYEKSKPGRRAFVAPELDVPKHELPENLRGLFRKARETVGFVINVFRLYSFRPERLSACSTVSVVRIPKITALNGRMISAR